MFVSQSAGVYKLLLRTAPNKQHCLNYMRVAYEFKCSLLKGDPLSDFSTSGTPNIYFTLSDTGITVLAEIDLTVSKIGCLECSLMLTSKYSPFGSGP